MKIVRQKRIKRQDLRRTKDTHIYLFGDNMLEEGYGGQAKEMRGEPNAIGIPTKWKPTMEQYAFFSNEDYFIVSQTIHLRFLRAYKLMIKGKIIVIPADGIGTGRAKLKEKAPAILILINRYIEMLEVKK